MALNIIVISSKNDILLMYIVSSKIFFGKTSFIYKSSVIFFPSVIFLKITSSRYFIQPGLTHQAYRKNFFIIHFKKFTYLGSSGLGPTILISPFKMLINWGISSSLTLRKILPMPVTLTSFIEVIPGLLWLLFTS